MHRSSVTLIAKRPQQAGLVEYYHGKIRIPDVEGLKEVSRERYEALNDHFRRIIGWDPHRH